MNEMDFESMLDASLAKRTTFQPGDRLEAKVVSIGREWIFLDLGIRSEGLLARSEVVRDGEVTVAEGQRLTVTVSGVKDGAVRCAMRLGATAGANLERHSGKNETLAAIEQAMKDGVPVEGTIKAVNKGGFEVTVLGQRAFCPVSQIDLRYCERPEEHLGRSYPFLVTRCEENGRNVVLSRKELLRHEAVEAAERFFAEAAVGATMNGTVTSLQKYGAFVELAPSVEGLIHVSELSWDRVEDPASVLAVGQEVTVQIKELDRAKRKISLSLKALSADPWAETIRNLQVGGEYQGTVRRLQNFGAFVELAPGVEGLVHISRLGVGHRINHAREAVELGQSVRVSVVEIDESRRRIALSMEGLTAEAVQLREAEAETRAYLDAQPQKTTSGFGTLGDLLQRGRAKR